MPGRVPYVQLRLPLVRVQLRPRGLPRQAPRPPVQGRSPQGAGAHHQLRLAHPGKERNNFYVWSYHDILKLFFCSSPNMCVSSLHDTWSLLLLLPGHRAAPLQAEGEVVLRLRLRQVHGQHRGRQLRRRDHLPGGGIEGGVTYLISNIFCTYCSTAKPTGL